MSLLSCFIVACFLLVTASSFSSFTGAQLKVQATNSGSNTLKMEYIRKSGIFSAMFLTKESPSTATGMSKEQWKAMKEKERTANKGKNLGKTGITTFKSRTFAEWQKSGGVNLFPVDPRSVKNAKELPYMQRPGGSADDSDLEKKPLFGNLFGAKKQAKPTPEPEAPPPKNWWTL